MRFVIVQNQSNLSGCILTTLFSKELQPLKKCLSIDPTVVCKSVISCRICPKKPFLHGFSRKYGKQWSDQLCKKHRSNK